MNKPKKTIEEIEKYSRFLRKLHPELREGQALMVAINEVAPLAYEKITTTKVDCFYSDNSIAECKLTLQKLLS